MEQQFKLGPIQTAWLKELREHPERQGHGWLGITLLGGERRMCCLGQLHVVGCEISKIAPYWSKGGKLYDGVESSSSLKVSYIKYGLIDEYGSLKARKKFNGFLVSSLAALNDHGMPWPEIADYIEANPESVFTHSA